MPTKKGSAHAMLTIRKQLGAARLGEDSQGCLSMLSAYARGTLCARLKNSSCRLMARAQSEVAA